MPSQIKVQFENQSWAIVPISSTASLEEIDQAVSFYDPDFMRFEQPLANPLVEAGMVRSSVPEPEPEIAPSVFSAVGGDIDEYRVTLSKIASNAALADYLSSQGDDRLKQAVTVLIQELLSDPNFNLDSVIENLTVSDEDILELAEQELQNATHS